MWDNILNFFERVGDFFSAIYDFICEVLAWILESIPVILTALAILFFAFFGIFSRGCGYHILKACGYTYGYEQSTTYAVEGTHYSVPELEFEHRGDQGRLKLTTEVYNAMKYDIEICIMQDGVNLYTYNAKGTLTTSSSASRPLILEESFVLSHYNPEGGEIYYFINYFNGIVDR